MPILQRRSEPLPNPANVWRDLTVLSALGIPNSETRNTILVDLGVGHIQECERRIASLLGVVAWRQSLEPGASSKVVLKSDIRWQVGAGVESTRSLAIIPLLKSVLKYPVGTGLGSLETAGCAVTGIVDAVAEEEIDFGDNTSDIDAREVTDTPTLVGRSLEVWELVLCDLPCTDGVIVILVA